jgi:hypothetical protein
LLSCKFNNTCWLHKAIINTPLEGWSNFINDILHVLADNTNKFTEDMKGKYNSKEMLNEYQNQK